MCLIRKKYRLIAAAILLLLTMVVCFGKETYSYDLNGNVTTLRRIGLYDSTRYGSKYGLIDFLTLEYDGNMLRRVSDICSGPYYQGAYHFVDGADEAVEYAYDGNGNTTMDLNRRVTAVGYDTNNRPRLIEFEGGSSTAYLYDAAGVKRRTLHSVATERPSVPGAEPQEPELTVTCTDYCGDIVYEDSLLSRINFDGGYLSFTNNAGERLDRPVYHFYHRDHLGNNRMDLGENGAVWQICHYYPYGMLMGCSYIADAQRWKFGGKELDRVSGLDLLDFEARPYDATLGRFWRPDDLADKYHPLSPFLYCAANPLGVTDPTGEFLDVLWDVGNVIYDVAAAAVNYVKGDKEAAKQNIVDAGFDLAAAAVPFVPAGASKAARVAAKTIDATADVAKGASKGGKAASKAAKATKKTSKKTVTFIQGSGEKAKKVTVEIPDGYNLVNSKRSKGQKIYTNGKDYISPDKDGHNGGVWKKAKSEKDLSNKNSRTGTYDKDLKKIGE